MGEGGRNGEGVGGGASCQKHMTEKLYDCGCGGSKKKQIGESRRDGITQLSFHRSACVCIVCVWGWGGILNYILKVMIAEVAVLFSGSQVV